MPEHTLPDVRPTPTAPILLNVEDINGRPIQDDDGLGFLIYDADGWPVVEVRAAALRPDPTAVIQGASRFASRWSRYLTMLAATPPPTTERAKMLNDKFRKSTASGPNNDACVEVRQVDGQVEVRHSKDQAGPVLAFTAAEWDAFLTGAKRGEFDR